MNPISNLNIGARLWTAFGLLIGLLVVLSVLATGGLRQFGAAFEHVMEDRYANIRAVAALSDDVGVVVLAVRNFVMLNDPAKRAQELTTLKDTRQAINDDYKTPCRQIRTRMDASGWPTEGARRGSSRRWSPAGPGRPGRAPAAGRVRTPC
jgi:hypothetical protein